MLLFQINDMDAQNAAESDQTRPAGASPQKRQGSETDKKSKSPTAVKAASPARDAKSKPAAADDASTSTARPDDPPEDRDSDAETIVLPGKDGHSPSKARKVRQEDKSESDGDAAKGNGAAGNGKNSHDGDKAATVTAGNKPGEGTRRKRLSVSAGSSIDKDRRPRAKEAPSSGLSSAPASPPHNQQHQTHHPNRRRRSDAAPSSPSDSEQSHHKTSSKTSLRDKLKSGERLVPHKRKAPKVESDDEGDLRKARRQRTTSASLDGRLKEPKPSHPKHDGRNRSISPPPRQHRRSTSTQLPSQSSNGLGTKKRRLPPPLQPTDYQSDDSSTGGSPHPRSSKLRSLATPASADANISPAKMGPHKKHLDAHGQTLLARACARGEYDGAKQRLQERPEDLNVADYAGNTPLQIAAINGCEDIVKLLIDAGCNLDCVNYDKDTPLLDAVDNGHLGVVKLLLDAGVNPRKANVNGEEPIDRVSEDTDNAEEIRAALSSAKKRQGERRRTSEDRHSHTDYHDARDSHAPDSPRHSPAAASSAATGRRSGTVRSTKTRNDLLYMPLDDKTLRQAAGRGDEETVARILQVKEGYDDPESMVAAARGGHDLVIQLLLGLGGANADPGPVPSLAAEFATPILAAIGQENIKVVELLLEQQGFDPTRRFKGETYYEIARRRQGTNWKDEETKLKEAYDDYKRSHKDGAKTKSPGGRRERDKASRRDDAKDESKVTRRRLSSPSRESELKRKSSKLGSPREKRRNSINHRGEEELQKKGPGRPRKEHTAISDRELSPALSHKAQKAKRPESDVAGMSSEGEAAKPRRKLVSKGELRGERDKHKRVSSHKEPSSPRESRGDEVPEKARLSEKYHDRAKALKRDESRDRPSGDGSTKRHRTSVTPDRPSDIDKDSSELPVKRRRLDAEGQESRQKRVSSEDGRQRKSSSSRDGSAKASSTSGQKERDDGKKRDADAKPSGQPAPGEKSIHVKSEDVDVPMPDLEPAKETESRDADTTKQQEEAEQAKKKEAEEEAARKKKAEEEEEAQKRIEAEEVKKREEEAARKAEEEQKRREEEEARKRKEQEERERLEAAQREEEERKKRLEEEKKKKEEEERRQREEEERLRREQLEREAAEAARRQREEEERKERERRERAHREELERKRAAREAEQRRIREEQERARLEKLPPLLRWLDMHPGPQAGTISDKFKHMLGVRYDTIRPEATGTAEGREQWLLNTNVALLLGEKDLDLSRCTYKYLA